MEAKAHCKSKQDISLPASHRRRIDKDVTRPTLDLASPSVGKFAMSILRNASSKFNVARKPRVCVVGAGVAGLRCTEVLIERGIDVTVIEGRNRIGGRVHQTNLNGRLVDMGANWIHGTDKNPILELANETKTSTASIDEVSAAVDENGQHMDPKKANYISELVWGIISDAFQRSNASESIPSSKSLKDFFLEEIETKDITFEDRRTALLMAEMWGAFVGSSIENQSLKYFWLEECIDGENLFIPGTYNRILDRIARTAVEKATVRLSTVVTSISTLPNDYLSGGVQVGIAGSFEKITFDAIVLTIPLGCLKDRSGVLCVEPPLPARLQNAIHNLSFGNLEKVYINFSTAWWDDSTLDPFPAFTHFMHPKYAKQQNPEVSIVEMLSMSRLKDGQPTLLFYIHGDFAQRVVERLGELSPNDPAYLRQITERFKPYFSRLPNYDAKSRECTPVAACATAWSIDQLAGYGSYSNFQIPRDGVQEPEPELDKDIEILRHGCPERALWIAGEHTAPFIALGTVTGAYWSGERVACQVAEAFEGFGRYAETIGSHRTVQIGKGPETGVGGVKI